VCTSLLVNQTLKGRFLAWAVVGTFGDNLHRSATAMAKPLNLTSDDLEKLSSLGLYLNYNGYGATLDDLYFSPAELFKRTSKFITPQQFIAEDSETFNVLETGYHSDMTSASQSELIFNQEHAVIYQLPNEAWARRVSGVFGNDLANQSPSRAHAVITEKSNGNLLVSVRAPLNNKRGADEICRQFPTGGGRSAAAGINKLEQSDLARFIETFSSFYK